jgi:hypothetical protein
MTTETAVRSLSIDEIDAVSGGEIIGVCVRTQVIKLPFGININIANCDDGSKIAYVTHT